MRIFINVAFECISNGAEVFTVTNGNGDQGEERAALEGKPLEPTGFEELMVGTPSGSEMGVCPGSEMKVNGNPISPLHL